MVWNTHRITRSTPASFKRTGVTGIEGRRQLTLRGSFRQNKVLLGQPCQRGEDSRSWEDRLGALGDLGTDPKRRVKKTTSLEELRKLEMCLLQPLMAHGFSLTGFLEPKAVKSEEGAVARQPFSHCN